MKKLTIKLTLQEGEEDADLSFEVSGFTAGEVLGCLDNLKREVLKRVDSLEQQEKSPGDC